MKRTLLFTFLLGLSEISAYAVNSAPIINLLMVTPNPIELTCQGDAIVTLSATITDDGLPNPPSVVCTSWTVVTGDANHVKFGNAHFANTVATITQQGIYQFMLAATDGLLITTRTAHVQVNAHPMPITSAGPDQTILWTDNHGDGDVDGHDFLIWQRHFGAKPANPAWYAPADINGNGEVDAADYAIWRDTYGSTTTFIADIDYGTRTLLVGNCHHMGPVLWRKVSGPGLVDFSNAASTTTSAAFSAPGQYVIDFVTYECGMEVVDQVVINVILYSAPIVNAGPDVETNVNQNVQLNASVDISTSLPVTLTYHWTIVSGPANPSFSNPNIANPSIAFPAPGTYVLDVEVFDGTSIVHDQIVVTVLAPSGPVQSGTIGDTPNVISRNNPTISFPINVNQSGNSVVKVYDHTGDLIKTLFDGFISSGVTQIVTWDGGNLRGHEVGSGVYVVLFELPGQNIKKKVIVSR